MLPDRLPKSLSFSGKDYFCVHKGCTRWHLCSVLTDRRAMQSSPPQGPHPTRTTLVAPFHLWGKLAHIGLENSAR